MPADPGLVHVLRPLVPRVPQMRHPEDQKLPLAGGERREVERVADEVVERQREGGWWARTPIALRPLGLEGS